MTRARSILSSGLKLGANEGANQAGSFLRSIIIARLITPEHYGIAATFALSFAFLEMISNLASERLLVQAENADEPEFQGTAHLLQSSRGALNAVLLFLAAGPLSRLFGVPEAEWAFRCLGGVPLIRGLAHTDMFRLQRAMKFDPWIKVNLSSTLLITIGALPMAWWLRNYAVMVWVLLLQAAAWMVTSHLVAERPYRWAWRRSYANQMFVFGWPLLINGLLMYLIFQGDRLVIGASTRLFARASYTLADLAAYSLALSLSQMPQMFVANVCTSLFLPILSRVQNLRARFEQDYLACSQFVCLAAAASSLPLIVAGGWLIVLIYGNKYSASGVVIGWLAAMQALRIIRVAPTLGAMALGDTKNAMISNLARTLAFVCVLIVAAAGGPLQGVAAAGFAGELFALAVCLYGLSRNHAISARYCLEPCAVVTAGLVVAAIASRLGLGMWSAFAAIGLSAFLFGAVLTGMLIIYPELRTNLRTLLDVIRVRPVPEAVRVSND
jgi:O-antigen/teichoic acid export membrane protein